MEETQDLQGFRKPGPRRFRVKIVRISSGRENLTGIFADRTKLTQRIEDLIGSILKSIWSYFLYPFSGGSRWVERRVEFMILEFVGRVLLNVLKAMVWMALLMLRCVLGLAKLTLLVFGLVARVFLVFAKAVVD